MDVSEDRFSKMFEIPYTNCNTPDRISVDKTPIPNFAMIASQLSNSNGHLYFKKELQKEKSLNSEYSSAKIAQRPKTNYDKSPLRKNI